MTRQEANLKLVEVLKQFIEQYPDIRFGQVLNNFFFEDVDDVFYEEPEVTLKRLESKFNERFPLIIKK